MSDYQPGQALIYLSTICFHPCDPSLLCGRSTQCACVRIYIIVFHTLFVCLFVCLFV